MSIADYCKTYTVKIETEFGRGTGCLFQPSSEEYTYVLTAKHLFQNNDKTEIQTKINEHLLITRSLNTDKLNPLDLYHHEELDLTIVKVDLINGLDDLIYSFEIPQHPTKVALFGYPKHRNNQDNGIEDKFLPDNTVIQYRDNIKKVEIQPIQLQDQELIIGFSGCGVFETKPNSVRLVGIEVSMADEDQDAEGRMLFIPLNEFKSIIENNNLAELIPLCKSNFKYVVDKSFRQISNTAALSITKRILKTLAEESIIDFITPNDVVDIIDIKKALINEECLSYLDHVSFWTIWLEFLVINRFIVNMEPNESNDQWMKRIYDYQHFLFLETNDWTEQLGQIVDFWREKLSKNQSTLLVSCLPNSEPSFTTIDKRAFLDRINRVAISDVINNSYGIQKINDGMNSLNYKLMHLHRFSLKISEHISEYGKEEREIIYEIKKLIKDIYHGN
jgi:hypothetical protein